MPTTTESGPVRTRPRCHVRNWTRRRSSHARWTSCRGLDTRKHAAEDFVDVLSTGAGAGILGGSVTRGARVLRTTRGRTLYKLHASIGDLIGAVMGG